MAIRLCRLGLADYQAVRDLQLRLVATRLTGQADDVILVTEHQPVFTLGRRGAGAVTICWSPKPFSPSAGSN